MAVNKKNINPSIGQSGGNYLRLTEPISPTYPDAKTEFMADMFALVAKWRGRKEKDADAYASACENVVCALLTPDTN